MSDIVNQASGELVTYDPVGPAELELMIRVLSDRLEAAIPVLKSMWDERYAAERNLVEAHAKAMLTSRAASVAEKRAEASIAALPFRLEFDLKKASLHAAEELQKALTAKLYGLLNLNKAVTAAYQSYGHGR